MMLVGYTYVGFWFKVVVWEVLVCFGAWFACRISWFGCLYFDLYVVYCLFYCEVLLAGVCVTALVGWFVG